METGTGTVHKIKESVFGGGRMLYSEFKTKEVINIKDCKRLGRVTDFEFDECSGQICKIIVAGGSGFFDWFKCEPDYTIPYHDIKQVGPDIILVDVKEPASGADGPPRRRKDDGAKKDIEVWIGRTIRENTSGV